MRLMTEACLTRCYSAARCHGSDEKTTDKEPQFGERHSRRYIKNQVSGGLGKDHYSVLGVTSTATPLDIKVAFRQLARKYHPDVNKDLGADEMFKTIRLAYEILSNKMSRYAYDRSLQVQDQAYRKKTYKHHPSAYNRQRPVNAGDSGGTYWKTDYGDTWDFSSGAWFRQDDADEFYRDFGKATAGRTPKDSWYRGHFEKWVRKRGAVFAVGWESCFEFLFIFCLASFIWHAFGAHLALTYFVFFILQSERHTAWCKLASVIAWLIGGHRGLTLQFGIATIRWLYGSAYDSAVAFFLVAIWIGGYLTEMIYLPRGAMLFMAHICLEAMSKS